MSRRSILRLRNTTALVLAILALVVANQPLVTAAKMAAVEYQLNRPEYKAAYGQWSVLEVPGEFQVNAIHAALLPTGKVLIIAGSGNDRTQFDAKSFKTVVWNPADNSFKLVETPVDMFCAGHAFLPSGNLLVAGGTRKYEVLDTDVTNAGGVMTVKNESPDGGDRVLPVGTMFVSDTGVRYATTTQITVPPATKTVHAGGHVAVVPNPVTVWVEAVDAGESAVMKDGAKYTIDGLTGADANNTYGTADKITLEKQEYQGIPDSYEFDPVTEAYVKVGAMAHSRWYPTLPVQANGNPLAISGLDQYGRVLPADSVEEYVRDSRVWVKRPDLARYFPTYPSLFLQADGRLFYSGSSTGFGPAEEGRTPGMWNLVDNTFQVVPGLPDAGMTETSASVLLPPAQDQKVMIVGGGPVGEGKPGEPTSTARTAVADLKVSEPRYVRGPDLAEGTRYPSTVILPDDTVLVTGGSRDYRGRGNSDNHTARIYHPTTSRFSYAADPTVGRNYHSEGLLLPDGRVVMLGSDPLFSDPQNQKPGKFEQRIEIFTPHYLFQGARPQITDGPMVVERGTTVSFVTSDPSAIRTARLMRPSAVTHSTDVEQRSIALAVTPLEGKGVTLSIPPQPGLVPSGWYMLFVTDNMGIPSVARWVQVL